jgi:hypothetical protein
LSRLQQEVVQHQNSSEIIQQMVNQGAAVIDDQGTISINEDQSRPGSK